MQLLLGQDNVAYVIHTREHTTASACGLSKGILDHGLADCLVVPQIPDWTLPNHLLQLINVYLNNYQVPDSYISFLTH